MGRPSSLPPGAVWIAAATLAAIGVSALLGFPLSTAEIVIFGLVAMGAYLAWTAGDRDARWGDVGRSLLLGALLALAFGLYDRAQQERDAEEAFRQTISLQESLRGADFSGDDLSELQLAGKDLAGAKLIGTDLSEANLTRADLTGAELDGADLRGADLTEATLTGASLDRANLDGAQLLLAEAAGVDLEDASARGTSMIGTDLRNSCFARADLTGARFAGAELYGAQFASADLRDTSFEEDYRPAFLGPTTRDGVFYPAPGFHGALHIDKLEPAGFELPASGSAPGAKTSLGLRTEGPLQRVTEVFDGDTLKLGDAPARLLGVDAPPLGESQGQDAREFLEDLLLGRVVTVEELGEDEFGRRLVLLSKGTGLVNKLLVEKGYTTVLPNDTLGSGTERVLLKAEQEARAAARGVWEDCPPN
jgi:uncharacterized protein YjbI with pentapeptide repeats/endonuclease YncB( thermonuclease family)